MARNSLHHYLAVACALAALCGSARATELAPVEQRIVAEVKAHSAPAPASACATRTRRWRSPPAACGCSNCPIAAVPAESRGAGDIQFAAPYVDSLDGLGVSGRGAHSPDEDLELASIERAAIRTALLIYRLTR
jgi:hypothetical protein